MVTDKWNIDVAAMDLPLAERFTISRGSWDVAHNVFVTVSFGELTGAGEVSPAEDSRESIGSVVRELHAADLGRLGGPFDLEGTAALLPAGSARCALDIALHDLAGKLAGISVSELLGTGGRALPATSVTLPIADIDHMVRRAEALADHPVLKMKVGFEGDVEAVRAVRAIYSGKIRVDANEGWDGATAVARLDDLAPLDIELCEQPIPAGDRARLREVTKASAIPIFADEDVCTAADVAALVGVVDGVNLKLRKAGGIRETVKAIATARAHGMRVMLGCDLESGVAATAQAHVAALVDHADIDGPLLLADDPFPGVAYSKGTLSLPQGAGLGLKRSPS